MPLFGAGVLPSCLLAIGKLENGVSHNELMLSTKTQQELPVGVAFPNAVFAYDAFSQLMVFTTLALKSPYTASLLDLGTVRMVRTS